MKKYHEVSNIRFQEKFLLMTVDGKDYRIDLQEQSPRLAAKSEQTKMNFVLSPAGYGLHWPEIDEDLSIDGMIKSAKPEGSLAQTRVN